MVEKEYRQASRGLQKVICVFMSQNYVLEDQFYKFGNRIEEARLRYNACEKNHKKNCAKHCTIELTGQENKYLHTDMPEKYKNCVAQ